MSNISANNTSTCIKYSAKNSNLRCSAELDSIASSNGRETASNLLPGPGEQLVFSCPDAEPYELVRPALPDEDVVATGRTCELWIDWFCQGSRTKSYMIKEGERRKKNNMAFFQEEHFPSKR